MFIFACDDRFTVHERWLYSIPKAFGIIMALIQLYGIIKSYEGNNIFLTI